MLKAKVLWRLFMVDLKYYIAGAICFIFLYCMSCMMVDLINVNKRLTRQEKRANKPALKRVK